MDRMKKEKKEKRSILPGVIIVSLLVAAVVYAVLLNAEKTALSDYEKGSVYVTTKPVPKGTLITADYITQKEVDKSLIPSGAVSNPEDLTDLISVYAVDQGSIITDIKPGSGRAVYRIQRAGIRGRSDLIWRGS